MNRTVVSDERAEFVRQTIREARTGLLIDHSSPDVGARAVFVAATMAANPVIGSATPAPESTVTLVLAAMEDSGLGPVAINCQGQLVKPSDQIRARFERLCAADEAIQPWLLELSGISVFAAVGVPQSPAVRDCALDLATATNDASDESPRVTENEIEVLEHLNGDHPELVESLAVTVLGQARGEWRLVGADPEGLDLAVQQHRCRLNFAGPAAWTFQALKARLKSLLATESGQAATRAGQD